MKRVAVVIAVLFVLFAAWFVAARYRSDLGVAKERIAGRGQLAQTPCGTIEYATSGEGRPVLMVHGAGGGFDQGLAFAGRLSRAGFRVIAPSRFGYLGTPLPADASPAAQADAHACLLDALGVREAAVIGGSAGAPSAMQLCLRHPERCSALVLAVPLAWSDAPSTGRPPSRVAQVLIGTTLRSDFVFWAMTKLFHDSMVRSILATPPEDVARAGADERARVDAVLASIEPIHARTAGLRNDMAVAQALPRYELEKLDVPTLTFSVRNDLYRTWRNAQYTAEHVRGARFTGYETGGHLWVGHDDDVWNDVAAFLRGVPAVDAVQ